MPNQPIIKRSRKRVFGYKTLARERAKARVSVKQLADAIGVSRITVHEWERGKYKPTLDHLADIARALKVSIDSFYVEERK